MVLSLFLSLLSPQEEILRQRLPTQDPESQALNRLHLSFAPFRRRAKNPSFSSVSLTAPEGASTAAVDTPHSLHCPRQSSGRPPFDDPRLIELKFLKPDFSCVQANPEIFPLRGTRPPGRTLVDFTNKTVIPSSSVSFPESQTFRQRSTLKVSINRPLVSRSRGNSRTLGEYEKVIAIPCSKEDEIQRESNPPSPQRTPRGATGELTGPVTDRS